MEEIIIVQDDNPMFEELIRHKELLEAKIAESVNDGGQYEPNFTIPGQTDGGKFTSAFLERPLGYIGPDPSFLDTISIALLSVTSPVYIQYLAAKRYVGSDEEKQKVLDELNRRKILAMSLSKEQAKRLGFRFPPGHPRLDNAYRQHPLAERKQTVKKGFYLPALAYETVLLEERESELLELLMDLGACEIQITKQVESLLEDTKELKAGLSADGVAGVTAGGKICTGQNDKEANKRVFKLKGRPWEADLQFDTEPYCWYEFEPSWKTIVKARLQGCTSAAIEVRQSSLFSENKELYLQAKLKLFEASGGMGIMKKDFQQVSFLVEVKFPE